MTVAPARGIPLGWEQLAERHLARHDTLSATRRQAWDRFVTLGFPTFRDEAWRFTSVEPITRTQFAPAPAQTSDRRPAALDEVRLTGPCAAELVFVNGIYSARLSRLNERSSGLRFDTLSSALATRSEAVLTNLARVASFERQVFVALNTALIDDGAVIRLARGTVLESPVHVVFLATPDVSRAPVMTQPRLLVELGARSQLALVETYVGVEGASYFANAVTEIVLEEGTIFEHYKRQYESTVAYHIATTAIRGERNATCTTCSISLGGGLVRNDIIAELRGEGGNCTLNGLYLADGHRLVDHHTTIDHIAPNCGSREIYRGVLAGHARGVFNGTIIVRPDAQRSDAKQTNRALLLSNDAQINTNPELEIFANDVKCTHGAAIGQLDDEALFYLRSRGLGGIEARRLLVRAFAADLLERVSIASVRADLEARLERQLSLVWQQV